MKKDIYLPHIHYTVRLREFKSAPSELPNALAYTEHDKNGVATVYMPSEKVARQYPGDIAHELVHVLQFICLDRNMRFELEQEHCAYIMHYLMGEALGATFK